MTKKLNILILMILFNGLVLLSWGQPVEEPLPLRSHRLGVQILDNDTVYLAFLRDIYVFPKMQFKNQQQEKFYWKTIRDVKKVLPYAKIVGSELIRVNALLGDIEKEKDRRKYLAQYEKEVFKRYEPELRKFTLNQGRLLLKLIDRECNSTSYDLIKNYRGSVAAFFWQGIARIFGSNLKSEYDATGNDKIIERVILLVEAGQL